MAGTRTIALRDSPLTSPLRISDLGVWLDADAITGVADGGGIASWPDLSGNGFSPAQGTGANQPLWKSGVRNGHAVARFDGSDDFVAFSGGALGLLNGVAGFTLFMVIQTTAPGSQKTIFVATTAAGTTRLTLDREAASAGTVRVGGRRLDANTFAQSSGGTVVAGAWSIDAVVVDYATAGLRLRQNGTTVVTNTAFQTAGTVSATDSTLIRIGTDGAGTSAMNGDIGEIIAIRHACSEHEARRIEVYLARKWDIAVASL